MKTFELMFKIDVFLRPCSKVPAPVSALKHAINLCNLIKMLVWMHAELQPNMRRRNKDGRRSDGLIKKSRLEMRERWKHMKDAVERRRWRWRQIEGWRDGRRSVSESSYECY